MSADATSLLPAELAPWLERHFPDGGAAAATLRTVDYRQVAREVGPETPGIVHAGRVNDVRYVNKFLKAVHARLSPGGALVASFESHAQRRRMLRVRHPPRTADALYLLGFLVHRALPKLPYVARAYFAVTRGRGRMLSRAEVLGRLCYCGFRIAECQEAEDRTWVVAHRASEPRSAPDPSYGPLFGMSRVGRGGAPIRVYKLRTMFPYSEYLQEYVYEHNRMGPCGKVNADYRVTGWGRRIRRLWIDELPMLFNWFRGDLKLVGVRPLSRHFESIYPEALRERRRRTKPGLIPPYYAQLSDGAGARDDWERILESENRYLDVYEREPLRTDVRYFCAVAVNIFFRGVRSQ